MALATFSTDIKAQEVTCSIKGYQLQFQISKVGNGETKGTNRTMPYMPTIYQLGHTLYKMNSLPACTLRLADEDGNIVYETTLRGDEQEIQLPDDVIGSYELQIEIGRLCYLCTINI